MLGGILKLSLSFSALFLFVALLWQSSVANALPVLLADDNMVKSSDEMSDLSAIVSHSGAPAVTRFLHTAVDQPALIDRPRLLARPRHLRKSSRLNNDKSSLNLFQSTGSYNKNLRAAKRMKTALDNRLKRFRMLDQDEFQEMLKSLGQQTGEDQSKAANGMDAIGGMQLANYWSSV